MMNKDLEEMKRLLEEIKSLIKELWHEKVA